MTDINAPDAKSDIHALYRCRIAMSYMSRPGLVHLAGPPVGASQSDTIPAWPPSIAFYVGVMFNDAHVCIRWCTCSEAQCSI